MKKSFWFPLCGTMINEEDTFILVEATKETKKDTYKRFGELMKTNGFDVEDDWIVKNIDCAKFTKVMENAGWEYHYIPIGP